MNKQAQVSIFIIIGVLIVGVLGVFYVIQSQNRPAAENQVIYTSKLPEEPQSFEKYITGCITEEARPLVSQIGLNGGTLSTAISRMYKNVSYNYICSDTPNNGCANNVITRDYMEKEIERELLKKVKLCIDMEQFKQLGYKVTEGDMNISVTIAIDRVNFLLTYPIKVEKNDKSLFDSSRFATYIDSNLGEVYDLAMDTVNSEIEDGSFNKDEWMNAHGGEVGIEKYRPYPDIIYSLTKYDKTTAEFIKFNFAIQGKDTVSLIGKKINNDIVGYCYTERDKNCFANSDQAECTLRGGLWSTQKPNNCTGLTNFVGGCKGNCSDCGSRKDGETWCEYDGITGDGLDYVGSRHFLRSCHNGKIYYEDCRDYREEICVQDQQYNEAMCRPNRWQDCVLQSNEADCLNLSQRDCIWNKNLKKSYVSTFEERRCMPIVPPGFKHWLGNGFDVCQMANEYNDCDGIGCPQDWTNSNARYCYAMGDCGASRNIADQLSVEGYQNTNSRPDLKIFLQDGLITKGQEYVLNLPGKVKAQEATMDNMYANPESNVPELVKKLAQYVDVTTGWSKEEFMEQYIFQGSIDYWTRHVGFCSVWMNSDWSRDLSSYVGMPSAKKNFESKCFMCHSDPNKPCSEYRCKSLGANCLYEEVSGYGRCYQADLNDTTPIDIKIDKSRLPAGTDSEDDYFLNTDGWHVINNVTPMDIMTFGVTTNKETQCGISLLPDFEPAVLPMTITNFSKEHGFKYQMPDIISMREKIKQSSYFMSILSLSKLDELEKIWQKMKKDAQDTASNFGVDISPFMVVINRYESQYYHDIKPAIQKYVGGMEDTLKNLLVEIDSGRVILFVRCKDRTSTGNVKEAFFKFDVSESREPPKISGQNIIIEGNQANISFETNVYAECRYSMDNVSFDEMYDQIPCSITYDNTNLFYYICSKQVDFAPGVDKVYVRCKDKPIALGKYAINFVKADTTEISRGHFTSLISINGSFINVTDVGTISKNDTTIASNYSSMTIRLNFGENNTCRYGNESLNYFEDYPNQQMNCIDKYCEKGFDIYNRSVYFGCRSSENVSRNEMLEPMIFDLS